MLVSGTLPAQLVLANPYFLRPCRSTEPRAFPRLGFCGADLLHGMAENWCVVAGRCGGANGVGFSAENHALLARILPEIFDAVQARAGWSLHADIRAPRHG